MATANNNYWTDEHEALVVEYQEANTSRQREIYKVLRPLFIKIIESVCKRYFANYIRQDLTDLFIECESKLISYAIFKYDQSRGNKSYSYLGTAARNFFHERLLKEAYLIKPKRIDDLSHDEYETLAEPVESEDEILDEVRTKANLHLQSIIHKKKDVLLLNLKYVNTYVEKEVKVLQILYRFINDNKDFNKFHLTYHLLHETKYGTALISKILCGNGLQGIAVRKYTIDFYHGIIDRYVEKHGKEDEYIRKAFVDFKNKGDEETVYRIQDKKRKKPTAALKRKAATGKNKL